MYFKGVKIKIKLRLFRNIRMLFFTSIYKLVKIIRFIKYCGEKLELKMDAQHPRRNLKEAKSKPR